MRGGIKSAAHDAGDLTDPQAEEHAGNDTAEGKTAEGRQDEQCNDKAGAAGLFVAVGVLLAHGSVSLLKHQQLLYHMKNIKERKNRLKIAKNRDRRDRLQNRVLPFAKGRNDPAAGHEENVRSRPDTAGAACGGDPSFPPGAYYRWRDRET